MAGLNQFTNNASSTLASSVAIGATSLTVAAGTGSLFPTLAGSQYFYCTLANLANTAVEIVKVTARSTDTFTIVRGQDGTSDQNWSSGDKVELRLTAADLQNFPQLDSTNTFAQAQTFSATPVFNAGITSTATPVSVASGGTGLGTLTANNVILGNGASAPNFVAPGANGNILSSNGTTWVSTPPVSGARSGASYATLSVGTPNITLTDSSNQLQVITATAEGQTITLPDMTTLTKGNGYFVFYNTSSYPIGLKDTGGTIREYLYPSKTGSPISAVALNIEDTSTANGVWHAHNPISAGIFPASTYTAYTPAYSGDQLDSVIQCGPTYYIWLSRQSNTGVCYAKLGTLNLSTKTFTFGSSITLSGSSGTWSYNGGFGESNGVDKGILAEYWGVNPGGGTMRYWGFAIVSGVLYVSGNTTAFSGNSATVGNAYGVLAYAGNDCFLGFNRTYLGTYTNNNANAVGYKVTVSGTTVTLTAATGNNIAYAASGTANIWWYGCYTSRTTLAVDQDGGANPRYVNYDTSTNTLSGGTRTAQTTQIAGNVMGMTYESLSNASRFILPNNAGTKIINYIQATAVTNVGTASLTAASTTINFKAFAAKSYSSVSAGFSVASYYQVSSSNYTGHDSSNQYLINIDPSNADFNINYCALDLGANTVTGYVNSATQFTGMYYGAGTYNVVSVGSPFVS